MIKGHRPEAKPACPECGCTSGHRKACSFEKAYAFLQKKEQEAESVKAAARELSRTKELLEGCRQKQNENAEKIFLLERRLLNVIAQNRELRARIHVMQETVANIKRDAEPPARSRPLGNRRSGNDRTPAPSRAKPAGPVAPESSD